MLTLQERFPVDGWYFKWNFLWEEFDSVWRYTNMNIIITVLGYCVIAIAYCSLDHCQGSYHPKIVPGVSRLHRRIHQGGRGGPDPRRFLPRGSVYDLDPSVFLQLLHIKHEVAPLFCLTGTNVNARHHCIPTMRTAIHWWQVKQTN